MVSRCRVAELTLHVHAAVSHRPSAVRMWRTAMPGSVGFAPFLSTLANGILSLLHSLVVRNPLLRLCGVVSTVAGLAYVSVAISVAPRRRGKVQGAAAVLAVALALAALLASGSPLAGHAIGVVFSGCGVWVQTAPLAQAVSVGRGCRDALCPAPAQASRGQHAASCVQQAPLLRVSGGWQPCGVLTLLLPCSPSHARHVTRL